MLALKLVLAQDGFLLAYCYNHCFCDQASFFTFLCALSNHYNGVETNIINTFWPISWPDHFPDTLKTRSELRQEALHYAWRYSDELPTLPISEIQNSDQIEIFIDDGIFNSIKSQSDIRISKNDIINALLQKAFALNPMRDDQGQFTFGFASNARKICGYDNDAIGNIGIPVLSCLNVKDIRSATITELAVKNRKRLSMVNDSQFTDMSKWCYNIVAKDENLDHFVSDPLFNRDALVISNWSSFNYNLIHFDQRTPFCLLSPNLPKGFTLPIISFYRKPNGDYLSLIKFNSTPSKIRINDIQKMSEEYGFHYTASCASTALVSRDRT
jgi:hypothetical protein